MTEQNPNTELAKLARSLTMSTNAYSDALANIAKQTANFDAITRSITQQMDIEQKLFGSTDALLKQMRQLDTISPSIQSIVAANSSFTRMVERISVADTAYKRIFEDQIRIQNMIRGVGLSDSITAAFARIDTTRMLSASLAAQTKLFNLESLDLGRVAGLDQAFSKALSTNLGNLTRSYQSLIDVAATRDSLVNQLPLITTYAPVEYFRELSVLESITVDDDEELVEDE